MKTLITSIVLFIFPMHCLAITAKEKQEIELSAHKQVIELSNQINSTLPRLIDSDTQMDTTAVINKTFAYKYTLVNHTPKTLDDKTLHDYLFPKLVNLYCTNPKMRVYKILGYNMVHTYYGENGKYLSEVRVSTSDCK